MLSEELYIRSPNKENKMLQLLYKYLILKKKVTLPGLGVFYVHRQPSYLDFSNKQFIAPTAQITFTEGNGVGDQKFYHFLANEQQIDEHAAVQNFNGFALKLKEKLQSRGTLQLPEFGLLTKDDTGKIHFKAAKPLTTFYHNVGVERTMREAIKGNYQGFANNESDQAIEEPEIKIADVEETKIKEDETEPLETSAKKDYWWLYAVIVASIAVAAIAYYYYQNGSFR
jgi:nucleoid DNA-binding protein